VTVRAEAPADRGAVHRLVADAFGGEKVAELLEAMRESPAWLDLSFVAEQGSDVVGHVAFSRAWLDMPERLLEVLVLSPLAVRPDRQRSGIGSALVRRALELLQDRDEPLVFLEGDPGYYPRLGFVPAGDLGVTPPSVRIPAPAFQVVTLPGYDESMSGALVYPDVFWRHDAVGLRPPS